VTVDLHAEAKRRFSEHLEQNPYPGRGLVVGRSAAGDWLQVYWIMGRSENSRNRRFVAEPGGTLRTEAVDPGRLADPSLVIYEAMLELPGLYVVSNGDQTRSVRDALATGGDFAAALATREREPDAPNYTPRISALLDLRAAPALSLSVLRANDADPARTDRTTFCPAPPPPGLGLGLTTYRGDGDPLPSFRGDPLWLPLVGEAPALLEHYWQALDAANRVALAVKRIPAAGGPGEILVRNRFA
jgi:IMP cyclohydrolase